MKFLIDENVGQSIINYLKEKNYDVVLINKEYSGLEDSFIIDKGL